MKNNLKLILIAIIFLILPVTVNAKEVTLNLFYGKECPHCEAEQQYLDELKQEYKDELKIKKYEVWHNEKNSQLLEKVRKELNNHDNGVPYTVIGTVGITGYNENANDKIKELIDDALKNNSIDAVSYIKNGKAIQKSNQETNSKNVTVPLLGKINAKEVSLPLIAAVIGLVDGFNPCAMWVLLFLISMLITMKNKKRMWALGLTFLITSALVYLLFMVAWLNVAITVLQQIFLRTLIALIAIIGGTINLKSYIKDRQNPNGCNVIDEKKRTKIFEKIKTFTKEKSFLLATIGIITLAVSINLVELACSAGLPLLFTSILAINDLNAIGYAFNIFIYILFFLLDDIIVFVIAMKTLEVTGISTKYSKYSHLIGGILMFIVGILLIFKPEWIMFNF